MRILYFSRDVTTHDLRFVRAINGKGHDVSYLRLESDGVPYVEPKLPDRARFIEWSGGSRRRDSPQDVVQLLPGLVEVLHTLRPDLVHAGPVQTCALLSTLADMCPTVAVSWGSDLLVDADRDSWYRWATASTLKRAAGFVCDSAAVASKARMFGRTCPEHTAQFPWGLELNRYVIDPTARNSRRASLGWQESFVLIATRAWQPQYRIDVLLQAFKRALVEDPRLRMILCGAGPEESRLREFIDDPQIQRRIYCPGMVASNELNEWLAAADAYVSAVPMDGTSISLLEAMIFGRPVIIVDNPSNREWVTPGENGLLVRAGDVENLADAIGWLTAHRQDGLVMGERARSKVLLEADWDVNVNRLFSLYDLIAKEQH